MREYWRENLRRTFSDWSRWDTATTILSYVGVLILARLGWPLTLDVLTIALAGGSVLWLLILVLVVTPRRTWQANQKEVDDLKERLRPKLDMEFLPNAGRPYVQETMMRRQDENRAYLLRIFRVGIRNESGAVIPNVRVVLEKWEPMGENVFVFPDSALRVMDFTPPVGRVDSNPGDTPTAYVDVVDEFVPEGGVGSQIDICYGQANLPNAVMRGDYQFTLRVEGGAAPPRRRRYRLFYDSSSRLVMEEVASPTIDLVSS